jgi:hypothetical protein
MSPLYNAQNPPPALFPFYPQNEFLLFNAEALVAGEFSQQVHIPPNPVGGANVALRFTIDFSAAPGNFEIDVMEDDTDLQGAAHYAEVPVAGVINATNVVGGTQATLDLNPFQGQFVTLYVRTAPSNGGITCTARVARR